HRGAAVPIVATVTCFYDLVIRTIPEARGCKGKSVHPCYWLIVYRAIHGAAGRLPARGSKAGNGGGGYLQRILLNDSSVIQCYYIELDGADHAGAHACGHQLRGLVQVLGAAAFVIILEGGRIRVAGD